MYCGILMPNELIKMHEYYVKKKNIPNDFPVISSRSGIAHTVRKIFLLLQATFPLGIRSWSCMLWSSMMEPTALPTAKAPESV